MMGQEILERMIELVRGAVSADELEWWLVENRQELERVAGPGFTAELLEIDVHRPDWRVRFTRACLGNPQTRETAHRPHPVAARFVADVPVLAGALEAMLNEWGFERPGLLLQLSALGRAVAKLELSASDLQATADIIEHLIGSDDPSIADAAATGFIEAYVHHVEARTGKPAPTAWLGPEATAYVHAWDRFWSIERDV